MAYDYKRKGIHKTRSFYSGSRNIDLPIRRGYIRFILAKSSDINYYLYVNDVCIIYPLKHGVTTPYIILPEGDHKIKVTSPLDDLVFDSYSCLMYIEKDSYYTIIFHGEKDKWYPALSLKDEVAVTIPKGSKIIFDKFDKEIQTLANPDKVKSTFINTYSKLRIVNAYSPGGEGVDIKICYPEGSEKSSFIHRGAKFSDEYVKLPSGSYKVKVYDRGKKSTFNVYCDDGSVNSVFLIGRNRIIILRDDKHEKVRFSVYDTFLPSPK